MLTLFKVRGGFSPVASTNVGINPLNFQTISLNPFS